MNTPPKIPTIIGLLLLAVIIGSSIFTIERLTRDRSQAGNTNFPSNVMFTNISDTQMTISWTTAEASVGQVSFTPTSGRQIVAFDDRDTQDSHGKTITHHVTVKELSPDTSYGVIIWVNGKQHQNNGKPWQVKTFPSTSVRPSNLEPAYGSIVTQNGQPASGALVYVTLDGAQTLSTIANASGSWLVPLVLARTTNGASYTAGSDRITEQITVRFGGDVAQALTDTLNDSPVPEITVGKTYDFRNQQAGKLDSSPKSGSLADLISRPNQVLGLTASSSSSIHEPAITFPTEGLSLPTLLPIIQGRGVAGKAIAIELSVPKQTGETTVGQDGIWRFTPKKNLAPGPQSLTVITQNQDGTGITLTRTFEILKSGTQVLGEATPSGTLAPTPTVRTISPTPQATTTPASDETPTPTPTTQVPPVPGSPFPTILITLAGLLLVLLGIFFLHSQLRVS